MIRFLIVDLIVVVSAATGGLYTLKRFRDERRKKDTMEARFVGGPLDGETKRIFPSSVYVYDRLDSDLNAVYHHTGLGIFEYTGDSKEDWS